MSDTLFVILIGILGFSSTIISLWKDHRDKRFTKKIFKGLKKEFYFLTLIGFSILSLSIWQYFHNRNESDKEKKLASLEQNAKDSIMQKKIQKGIDSGIKMISEGFGRSFNEQGIRMDSLNFTLAKIKDSLKTIRPQAIEENPTILVYSKGISLDSFLSNNRRIRITLTSVDGGSTNLNLKGSLIILYENKSLIREVKDDPILDYTDRIPKGASKTIWFTIPKQAKINRVYLLISGTYTNLNGKRQTIINEMYEFNPFENVSIKMFDQKKNEILSKLNTT